jgi:hypothetical protein
MDIFYICSLGPQCHNATFLKQCELKSCSYPFDWIFSNYNIILHCIKDNFKIFLDKSYYIKMFDHGICQHRYYYEKENDPNMFNHFNVLENDEHYNYYIRCIDRFKNLLKYQECKLFTMFFINMTEIDNDLINNIIKFNDDFSKYTNNYYLLVIFHIPNKNNNHHIFTYKDNIHFLELHTLSYSNAIQFANEEDTKYLKNILELKYNFNLKD